MNASRPSEHPPVRGGNVKTFRRWDHGLQRQNVFLMVFKRVGFDDIIIVLYCYYCIVLYCIVCIVCFPPVHFFFFFFSNPVFAWLVRNPTKSSPA